MRNIYGTRIPSLKVLLLLLSLVSSKGIQGSGTFLKDLDNTNDEIEDIFNETLNKKYHHIASEESNIFSENVEDEIETDAIFEEMETGMEMETETVSIENKKYCNFCTLKDGRIYVLENTDNLNLEELMKKDYIWDGYNYCCNGIPEEKEFTFFKPNGVVINVIREKRKKEKTNSSNNKSNLSKRSKAQAVDGSEIHQMLKVASDERNLVGDIIYQFDNIITEDIYQKYGEKALKCISLSSEKPMANPYSDVPKGRKNANIRLGYGPPLILDLISCHNEEKCTHEFSKSKTTGFGYSYTLTDSQSNSSSFTYGNSTSTNMDRSISEDIGDTIEM